MVRLEPRSCIRPVVCVAPAPVRTEVARRLLPEMVPHGDAAANAGRSALLVAVLYQTVRRTAADRGRAARRDPGDRLHQHYRAAAMPETCALVGLFLRKAGILAVRPGRGRPYWRC